ncbi:T-cell immunoglobulin and mucin domain-containing protein 4 [Platysternon megacephalum]|nr:T-cell immunoglobulin and mucin domain-containing protein 4 [Platysternon megacephalum]
MDISSQLTNSANNPALSRPCGGGLALRYDADLQDENVVNLRLNFGQTYHQIKKTVSKEDEIVSVRSFLQHGQGVRFDSAKWLTYFFLSIGEGGKAGSALRLELLTEKRRVRELEAWKMVLHPPGLRLELSSLEQHRLGARAEQ